MFIESGWALVSIKPPSGPHAHRHGGGDCNRRVIPYLVIGLLPLGGSVSDVSRGLLLLELVGCP